MHILRDLFLIRILLSRVYCGVQGVSLYTHSWRLSMATLDPSKAYLSPPASLSSHTNVVKCWDEVFSLWYHCFHFFRCTTNSNRFIRTIDFLIHGRVYPFSKITLINCLLLHESVGFSLRVMEFNLYLFYYFYSFEKKECSLMVPWAAIINGGTHGTSSLALFLDKSVVSLLLYFRPINISSPPFIFPYFIFANFKRKTCRPVIFAPVSLWTWSSLKSSINLANLLPFISFHFYFYG